MVEPQQKVAFIEAVGGPIEPVVYEEPPYEEPLSAPGYEVAAVAVQRFGGRRGGEGETEPTAQATEVIPFHQRPPFISGPFKERVKVPRVKLVPVEGPRGNKPVHGKDSGSRPRGSSESEPTFVSACSGYKAYVL